jgi:hypothetical protein
VRRTLHTVVTVLVAVAAVGLPQAARAAPPAPTATRCSSSWHFITHGETGRNVRPDYWGNLFADGVPGNWWDQKFLFCRDPGWSANHYAIYANSGGLYWTASLDGDVSWVGATATAIESPRQLFSVVRFDATWWSIRWVGYPFEPYYVYPDRGARDNPLRIGPAPLTGNHLFRIQPSNLMG